MFLFHTLKQNFHDVTKLIADISRDHWFEKRRFYLMPFDLRMYFEVLWKIGRGSFETNLCFRAEGLSHCWFEFLVMSHRHSSKEMRVCNIKESLITLRRLTDVIYRVEHVKTL